MGDITRAEATLIARDAAKEALDTFNNELPGRLKPAMYEVAEAVAERSEKAFVSLFGKVLGADVLNDDHIRDFHKDIYFLRDLRVDRERTIAAAKSATTTLIVRWSVAAVVIGILGFLGIKIGH